MEQIRNLGQVIEAAKAVGPVPAAVVAPYDAVTLEAVKEGVENGLITAHLYGDEARIRKAMEESGVDESLVTIHDGDPLQPALDAVRAGEAGIVMKGSIHTPALLKACLNKEKGIRGKGVCNHVTVMEIPGWDRLLMMSDGGLNVQPDVDQKADIIRNLIGLGHALGVEVPKVAVLASVEEVKSNLPATMDAAALTMMNRRGQIRGGIVDGPLAMDNILSAEAAKKKGIVSEVAGHADAIVVPSIEVGNALGKSLRYLAGTINASIVIGMKVPVVLPSRAGELKTKWGSLALCVMLATKGRNTHE